MPSKEFHVNLLGLTGDEIANYSVTTEVCPTCQAQLNQQCTKAPRGQLVCKARFIAGLKRLGSLAEYAVRNELGEFEPVQDADDPWIPSKTSRSKATHRPYVKIADDDPWAES